MRPKLLQSFVLVVLFWFVATTLYWSFASPSVNLEAALRLKGLLPLLPFNPPAKASVLNALPIQAFVLKYWTLPVVLLSAVSFGLGYGAMWMLARRSNDERDERERGKGEFRGVTVTLGDLPLPEQLPRDEIGLESEGDELQRMTTAEKTLLEEILGTLHAANSSFAGAGVTEDLTTHVSNLAFRALQHRRQPALSALVAAAHELGKLTAYKKGPDGQWVELKSHDREAARILGTLPGWWGMPQHERLAVMLAVRYRSKPWEMPTEVEGDAGVYRTARDLLDIATGVQEQVVQEEQKKTLEKTELPDVVFDAFMQTLPGLAFQNRGLPKGVRAVAWKVGPRVYMLEIALREAVLKKIPAEIAGALKPAQKERPRLQPFTVELLKALDERGWLVREIGKAKLATNEAVWTIQAGKLEFKGVIVVDVPEDCVQQLPPQDSMYEISVVGPMFAVPGQQQFTKEDMEGLLGPAKAKETTV